MWPEAAAALVLAAVVTIPPGAAAQEALPADPQSGLVIDHHWELVRANCSGCHSTRLVTQNRMSADGWVYTIRWMQDKHNLWNLGENETKIVAYLATHYGVPERPLRRQPLNQPPLGEQERTP